MAYSKLPLTIQDFAAGYQTINQLSDNTEAVRDLYDLEHYVPADGDQQSTLKDARNGPILLPGQHDTPKVPRSVGQIIVSTATSPIGTLYLRSLALTGRVVVAQNTGAVPGMFGVYFIATVPLTMGWCEAHPFGTSTAPRKAEVRASTLSGQPGFIITLMELSAGGWIPAECSFSFTVGAEEVP